MAAEAKAKVPPYWKTASGTTIRPDQSRISEMQELVNRTWRMKRTRDREKGDKVPTGAHVLSVLHVENHANMEKYAQHLEQIHEKRKDGIPPFDVATAGAIATVDHTVNEMFLLHGTNPVAADAIARSDFRLDKAGSAKGTMFGPGIYLAENASKSDEYAKEGDGIFMGQYALLLCRAVAGSVFTSQEKMDHSGQVRSGAYDSVCGDRLAAVGTFREMIFFDEEPVYPEFIIIYRRSFDDTALARSTAAALAAAPSTAATPAPAAAPKASASTPAATPVPAASPRAGFICVEGSRGYGDDYFVDSDSYKFVGHKLGQPKYRSGDRLIAMNSNGHWTIRGQTDNGKYYGECLYFSTTKSDTFPPSDGWFRHEDKVKPVGVPLRVSAPSAAASASALPAAASTEPATGSGDRGPLEAFFHACGGEHWTDKQNWLSDQSLASWNGVHVNEHGNVIQIKLEQNNLTGTLSPAIGQLQGLERLYLRGNSIQGEVPREIGKCVKLKSLMLQENGFSGKLPKELLQLRMLEDISTDSTGVQDNGKFWGYRGAIKDSKLKHDAKGWLQQLNKFGILR